MLARGSTTCRGSICCVACKGCSDSDSRYRLLARGSGGLACPPAATRPRTRWCSRSIASPRRTCSRSSQAGSISAAPTSAARSALIEDARGLAEHELSQARELNRGLAIERDQALDARAAGRARPAGSDTAPARAGSRAPTMSPAPKRPRAAGARSDRRLRAASERMMLMRAFGQTLRQRGSPRASPQPPRPQMPGLAGHDQQSRKRDQRATPLTDPDPLRRARHHTRHAHRRAAHTPRAQVARHGERRA